MLHFDPSAWIFSISIDNACRSVRAILEAEQQALNTSILIPVQSEIPEGTAVGRLLASISSLTKPEAVTTLAQVSKTEVATQARLEQSLQDFQSNNPEKLVEQLTLLNSRVRKLAVHLNEIAAILTDEKIKAMHEARARFRSKQVVANRLRKTTFTDNMLTGTGSELWASLWEAARQYSQEHAYPDRQYPVVTNDAKCGLCQQAISEEAGERLIQFERFVASTTERELRQEKANLTNLTKSFADLQITSDSTQAIVNELRIEYKVQADAIMSYLNSAETLRNAIVQAISDNSELPEDCPVPLSAAQEAAVISEQIQSRIETLCTTANTDERTKITSQVQELRARRVLSKNVSLVLREIERKQRLAAYGLAINDTSTTAITRKSTAVTKVVVSQTLKQRFSDELQNLGFRHVDVELREAGGTKGVLFHKLVLTRAHGVELTKVASEGEQRCLSIAAFFAELGTAENSAGIVFDDPMSSLDYRWREGVARRLVQEARNRQVVVFTHDVVFLLSLKHFAKELGVDQLDQHVRHLPMGAGVCDEALPWVAMKISKKVGHLKNEYQSVAKMFNNGHQAAYEKECKYLYGMLREAWERALEEVLLGGIVERYRPNVQTQQIRRIADITNEDCQTLEMAMTKCSRWLTGHDEAAAARAPVPEPDELKADIDLLDNWVKTINKRRH